MSGHNRSKLSKNALPVLSSGRFSGRSLAIKKGPANPPTKNKRPRWYSGPPNIDPNTSKERGAIWNVKTVKKNPEGRF